MTFTKESITQKLKNLTSKIDDDINRIDPNDITETKIEEYQNSARKIREDFLSTIFNKDVFCLSYFEFTVYCQTTDEVKSVIELVQSFGYRNIETYIPLVSDGENGSKPDPDHNFAVRVNQSESLIFGNHSDKLLKMIEEPLNAVKEKIIYTYCYNNQASFTFRDSTCATALYESLKKIFDGVKEMSKENNKKVPEVKVSLKPKNIDNFQVDFYISVN